MADMLPSKEKIGNIPYKRDYSYARLFNTQILRPAVSDKIANLAQYLKSLGTAVVEQ